MGKFASNQFKKITGWEGDNVGNGISTWLSRQATQFNETMVNLYDDSIGSGLNAIGKFFSDWGTTISSGTSTAISGISNFGSNVASGVASRASSLWSKYGAGVRFFFLTISTRIVPNTIGNAAKGVYNKLKEWRTNRRERKARLRDEFNNDTITETRMRDCESTRKVLSQFLEHQDELKKQSDNAEYDPRQANFGSIYSDENDEPELNNTTVSNHNYSL